MPHDRRVARIVATCLAPLLLLVTAGGSGETPLTTADLVRFLKVGISERTILVELQSRGFAESLDDAREAVLREAGATETLVVAVRRAAPASPTASTPVPATVGSPADVPAGPVIASFASRTRTVRVPVSVLDKAGQPVIGLKAEDFRVSDEGKRQQVTLFSGERSALRIALALDVSGSMQNKIRQVEAALRHFIQLLEPVDEIMVITFNDRVHVLQDFTSDREELGRILDKLEPVGSTLLYDAAAEAIRRVARGPAESKAVVVVSDGVDTGSAISFNALRELARRSEVPVFSIGLDAVGDVRTVYRPPGHDGPGRRAAGVPARARSRARRRSLAGRRRPGRGHAWRPRRRMAGRRDRWSVGRFRSRHSGRLRRRAPQGAGGRNRRSRRDREGGSAALSARKRRTGERPAQGGGRVDRDDAAPPLSARLRAAGGRARLADDPRRGRASLRQRARAQGLLLRGLSPAGGRSPGTFTGVPVRSLPHPSHTTLIGGP